MHQNRNNFKKIETSCNTPVDDQTTPCKLGQLVHKDYTGIVAIGRLHHDHAHNYNQSPENNL